MDPLIIPSLIVAAIAYYCLRQYRVKNKLDEFDALDFLDYNEWKTVWKVKEELGDIYEVRYSFGDVHRALSDLKSKGLADDRLYPCILGFRVEYRRARKEGVEASEVRRGVFLEV